MHRGGTAAGRWTSCGHAVEPPVRPATCSSAFSPLRSRASSAASSSRSLSTGTCGTPRARVAWVPCSALLKSLVARWRDVTNSASLARGVL